MKLKNKLIYITGSSKRIGSAIALSIARSGGDLIIHHNKSTNDAESLKSEIEDIGQKVVLVKVDYSDPVSTQTHAENIFRDYPVYGLINNASLFLINAATFSVTSNFHSV